MRYIIGIDLGTTHTKAIGYTDNGEVLSSTDVSYPVFSDPSGRHELDPEDLWNAFLSVLKTIRQSTMGSDGLAGISFSCAMHSLIAVDGQGKPLTRAITWADLRSESAAATLKASEAGRRVYRQTGTPIHPMSPLSKLLWMRETDSVLFRQAARFISIKEYIWWRLFGQYEVDHSIASATGLLDIYTLDWYPGSLTLAGIGPGQLSALVPCTHVRSELVSGMRDLLGLPEGLPFVIGGSDGCLANLGSGALLPGETALTIGTSGAVRMTADRPAYDPQERIFNYLLTDRLYVSGGATNNGGSVVQWFTEQFSGAGPGTKDIAARVAEADKVPPGCDGLVFLPYLRGERAPVWDADAKGVWFGIRSLHTQSHFMRSVLEGIGYSLYQIGTSLEATIGPIQEIYASGGFTHSGTWLQMIADIFLKRVTVTVGADASATGAAIMGFYALGILQRPEDAVSLIRVKETYEPDEARHRIYQENFIVFSALYGRLKDLM
ncbi:MAG TPA: gluconokinase [Puia sp.]|jgi:gluconokinase